MSENELLEVSRIVNLRECQVKVSCRIKVDGNDICAFYLSDCRILIRSIVADRQARWWQLPWYVSNQQAIVDMIFNPQGEWLSCLTICGRLYLIPFLSLISKYRKRSLESQSAQTQKYFPKDMLAIDSDVIQLKLSFYLRSTSGWAYKSSEERDEEDLSFLDLTNGSGIPTCSLWWTSPLNTEYILVGSTEGLISFINLKRNEEECRCILNLSEEVISMDFCNLLLPKEKQKLLLIRTKENNFYKVLLQKEELITNPINQDYNIKVYPKYYKLDDDFLPQKINNFSNDCVLYKVSDFNMKLNETYDKNTKIAVFNKKENNLKIFYHINWTLEMTYVLDQDIGKKIQEILAVSCSALIVRTKETYHNKILILSLSSGYGTLNYSLKSKNSPFILQQISLHEQLSNNGILMSSSLNILLWNSHNIYQASCNWVISRYIKQLIDPNYSLEELYHIGFVLEWDITLYFLKAAEILWKWKLSNRRYQRILDLLLMSNALPSIVIQKLMNNKLIAIALEYSFTLLKEHEKEEHEKEEHEKEEHEKEEHEKEEHKKEEHKKEEHKKEEHEKIEENQTDIFKNKQKALKKEYELLANSVVLCHLQLASASSQSTLNTVSPFSCFLWSRSRFHEFIRQEQRYSSSVVIEKLVANGHLEDALIVGSSRNCVLDVFLKLIEKGMTLIPKEVVDDLISQGQASTLTSKACRSLFRSLDANLQVKILLESPFVLLHHQEWLLLNLSRISVENCLRIVKLVDPRIASSFSSNTSEIVSIPSSYTNYNDIITSEDMSIHSEEEIEFFFSILLYLNSLDLISSSPYSQQDLEDLLIEFKSTYRNDIVLLRCHDYKNWKACAVLCEVNEEYVNGLEYRLKDLESSDEKTHAIEEQLKSFFNSFFCSLNNSCSSIQKNQTILVLGRLILKWKSSSLSINALENLLLQKQVFKKIAFLLSTIFLSNLKSKSLDESFTVLEKNCLLQCRNIPFSGNFYFIISQQQMKQLESDVTSTCAIPRDLLFEMVKNNLERNQIDIPCLELQSLSINQLGSKDELETHIIAFTCGHRFPKRTLYQTILPQFEKKLQTLDYAYYNTKRILAQEYRKNIIMTSCPKCLFQQLQNDELSQKLYEEKN